MLILSNLEYDFVFDTLSEIASSLEYSVESYDDEIDRIEECQEMLMELYIQQREEAIKCLELSEEVAKNI